MTKKQSEKMKELWKNPDYRNHMIKIHKGQRPWNTGKKRSKKTREKISKSLRNSKKHKKAVSSSEYKRKIGLKSKEMWERPEYRKRVLAKWNNPKYRKFMFKVLRRNAINNWKRKDIQEKRRKSWKKKPNKFEKRFQNIMQQYFPLIYTGNFSFFVDGLNPDFIIGGTNICIDLFGDYWHKIKRDDDSEERKERFKKKGFKLIIIWQSQWKKNKNEVIRYCKSIIDKPTIC